MPLAFHQWLHGQNARGTRYSYLKRALAVLYLVFWCLSYGAHCRRRDFAYERELLIYDKSTGKVYFHFIGID